MTNFLDYTTGPQQIVQPSPPSVVTVVPNASFVPRSAARDSFAIARGDDVRSTPPSERQVMTAAAGDPIAILYGRDRIGPAIVRSVPYLGGIVWLYVWGYGPYDGYEKLWINDIDVTATLPAGVTFQHFDGTQVAASSLLVSAYAANGKTWTAIMPNVVYSVGRFQANAAVGGAPVVNMRWRGRKPYDPRTGLSVFSDNPALALRDMLTASRVNSFGFGLTVEDADIIALANEHDAMIGSPAEKRRTINYNFAERMPAQQMLETLRTAASCFVVLDTFPVRVIADKDAAAVRGFNRSQFRRLRVSRKSRYNRATVVQISYTRIVGDTYERHVAEYARPGVSTGVLPRIVNAVDMYWINRYSQAYREAIERANKLWNDVSVDADAYDEALEVTHGDIVELTDADNGFAAKKFRVLAVPNPSPSVFGLTLQEHDAANYSGLVQAEPSSDNTTLPDPREVPSISGLTLAEISETPTTSRIAVTWTPVVWPFLAGYRVLVYDEDRLVHNELTSPSIAGITVPPVPVGRRYQIRVLARSNVAEGPQTPGFITLEGVSTEIPGEMLFAEFDIRPASGFGQDTNGYGPWRKGMFDPLEGRAYRWYTGGSTGEPYLWQGLPDQGGFVPSASPFSDVTNPVESYFRLDPPVPEPPPEVGEFLPPAINGAIVFWRSTTINVFGGDPRVARFVADLPLRDVAVAGFQPAQIRVRDGVYENEVANNGSMFADTVTVRVVTPPEFYGRSYCEIGWPGKLRVYVATVTEAISETAPLTSTASGAFTVTMQRVYDKLRNAPNVTPLGTASRSVVINNITYGPTATTFDVRIFEGTTQVAAPFTYNAEGVEKL